MTSARGLVALFLVPSALLACSSSTSDPLQADGGFDAFADTTSRVPKIHRPTTVDCPTERPAGSATSGGACAKDADCTAGKNGRCSGGLTPNACTYDECAVDGDCGTAVCVCRDAAKVGAPNACFRGNCRTDVDCPGSYCSPSGVDIFWNCLTGVPIGAFGFFCHSPADECVDKEDCGTGNATCAFDADARHFKCLTLSCTR
jgi:hypothetical protein